VVETDRGGKSTFHGPGQLVCYPILDLKRHGRDLKQYVRNLEEALIDTLAPLGVEATRLEGLTGVWLERPPRKIASIGVHVSRWVTTHGYALNVDLDPAPFTDWITACGLEDAMFTQIARELGRLVTGDEVRPHAVAALANVFGLELEELPAVERAGLWPQPARCRRRRSCAGRSAGSGSSPTASADAPRRRRGAEPRRTGAGSPPGRLPSGTSPSAGPVRGRRGSRRPADPRRRRAR